MDLSHFPMEAMKSREELATENAPGRTPVQRCGKEEGPTEGAEEILERREHKSQR